jgi:cellulose synthase operon protein B
VLKRILVLMSIVLSAGAASAADNPVFKTFGELGAGKSPLRLTTWQAAYTVKLPVSPREVIEDVVLHLDTVNSTALIKSRSALSVRVNGRIVAQYPLDPEKPQAARDIPMPMDLLKVGYNDVEVGVVQHYTYDCEDPASPELWTELDSSKSGFTVNAKGFRPNTSPRLSQLNSAFDKRGWVSRPISMVVGTERVTEGQVNAASYVAQGIALRLGYRPMALDLYTASTASSMRPEASRFPGLSSLVVTGRDVVIVGRRSEISRYLDGELYAAINGPFVGTFSANSGDSVVLVVSGDTDDEVMQAARAVGDLAYQFPDRNVDSIKSLPAIKPHVLAEPRTPITFDKFDYRTTVARGWKVQPIAMEFRAPANYGADKGDFATLKLHFSYGAGLRQDSSMVIKLNGNFAVAVPLSDAAGAEYQKYEVKLPAKFVKAGFNLVEFEPVFLATKDRCQAIRDEGLVLTIYEDSMLELPASSVSPKAPDLARFSQGLWPYHNGLPLYLTAQDVKTAAAAIQLSAALAQRNRGLLEVSAQFHPSTEGHMLVVGAAGPMEGKLAKTFPLQSYGWNAEGNQSGLLQAVSDKRVITALVAEDAGMLKDALQVMSAKGYWNMLEGQAAVIDIGEKALITKPAEKQTDFDSLADVQGYFKDWRALALGAGALGVLFVVTFISALKRNKRVKEADDE